MAAKAQATAPSSLVETAVLAAMVACSVMEVMVALGEAPTTPVSAAKAVMAAPVNSTLQLQHAEEQEPCSLVTL
jgi:hypothetical protein